jgi:hypothetical protein
MSIILPDFDYTDAEILVTRIHKAFHQDETRTLLTVIPFNNLEYDNGMTFREAVFKAADALSDAYYFWGEDGIGIEVKFKIDYVNS